MHARVTCLAYCSRLALPEQAAFMCRQWPSLVWLLARAAAHTGHRHTRRLQAYIIAVHICDSVAPHRLRCLPLDGGNQAARQRERGSGK